MSLENTERLAVQAEKLDLSEISCAIVELAKTMADAKWSPQPRVLLELCIVKLSENGFATALLTKRQEGDAQPRGPSGGLGF